MVGLLSWGGPGGVIVFAEGINFVTFDEVTVWGGSSCDNPICAGTFYEAGNRDIAWEIVGAWSDDWVLWSYAECSGSATSGVTGPQTNEGPPPHVTLQ